MSLKLYTDKSEVFECNVSLQGASIKESKLRAIEQKETFKQKAKELESIKGDSELFEVYMGQLEPKEDKFPFNLSPDLFQSTKKPKKTSSSKIFPLSSEGGARRKKATYLQGLELSDRDWETYLL